MHDGFPFNVLDVRKKAAITLGTPEESYDLLMFLGAHGRYICREIRRKVDNELAAVGEILDPFAFPHIVEGWMRCCHRGPLMPCAMAQANPTRLDGPPASSPWASSSTRASSSAPSTSSTT